jgi:hypothetical protein
MQAARSSKIRARVYQTTFRYVPEYFPFPHYSEIICIIEVITYTASSFISKECY